MIFSVVSQSQSRILPIPYQVFCDRQDAEYCFQLYLVNTALFLMRRNPAKTLGWNSKSTVELTGQILKCDESRELDNCVLFKMLL